MLNFRLCKFVHLYRNVSLVLLFNQLITTFGSDYCSILRMDDYLKSFLMVIWAKIQWARDDEGAQTCINEGSTYIMSPIESLMSFQTIYSINYGSTVFFSWLHD